MSDIEKALQHLEAIAPERIGTVTAARAELAALKADSAALVASANDCVAAWDAGGLDEALTALADTAAKPHPGAAMLERMKRLERLEAWLDEQEKAAKRLPLGATEHGGPLHGASSYNLAMHVVRQVREALKP